MTINLKSGAPLLEIRRRALLIADAIDGLAYEQYVADQQRQASVERHLEVIGEAFRRLSDGDRETVDRIEASQGFIGLRNVIAHGYDRLVLERIWNAVTDELPSVVVQVAELLEELGEPR